MTTPEQWQRAKEVLDEALDMETEERSRFIRQACGGDADLLAEVETLLHLDDETELSSLFERPMFTLHEGQGEPNALGRVIDRYRLVEEIGRGGMGTVYLAERADEELEHRVAVKILKRGLDTDEIIDRFRRERQIVARLNHPHIANFLDAGTTDDGLPYFVLEYVEGRPIDRYCDEEGLSVEERLRLFLTVCDAVHFAHQSLVVHRDLKPGNILVTEDGSPKLLDFGIAKILTEDGGPDDVTRAEVRFFTRDYAAPEQIQNQPITTATDVYSLGVLLYVLLAGRRPFGKGTTEEDRTESLPQLPSRTAPAERGEQLSGDLDHIVLQALHPEPWRRYGSVGQLADDLRRYLDGLPVRATPDSTWYRMGKFVRRHRIGVATAAGFVLLVLAFGVVSSVLLNRSIREQRRAEIALGEAESATQLMVDVLGGADPDRARGETLTVLEALDSGYPKILESSVAPETKARLLDHIGHVYSRLGNVSKAEEVYETAHVLREDVGFSSEEERAKSWLNLASVSRQLGDRSNAEARLERVLKIYEDHLSPEDRSYRQALHDLAVLLQEKNEFEEAERLHRTLLELNQRIDGPDSISVADTLHNLGHVLKEQGKLPEAREHLSKALELRRSRQGTNIRAATTLNVLAATLEDMGNLERAQDHYEKSLEMRQRLFPDGHPSTAQVLNNLALLALQRGDLQKARSQLEEALEMLDAIGDSHPWLRPWIAHNLAEVLALEGNLDEAAALARDAIQTMENLESPPPRDRLADTESVLGFILTLQGKYGEAETTLQRAYAVLSREVRRDHRYTAKALDRLIALYEAWGKPEEADFYREVRDGPSAGRGDHSPLGIEVGRESREISPAFFDLSLY